MTTVHVASVVAAVLMLGVAVLQLALALGAPLGAYAWGGRVAGVLPGPLRVGSALSSVLLLGMCVLVLRVGWMSQPTTVEMWSARVISGFLALNTLGNLASASPSERRVMTPITLCLTLLVAFVAFQAA